MVRKIKRGRAIVVFDILKDYYGNPRFGNPEDPVDDLVYIILSNRTLPHAAQTAYRGLKNRFPKWEMAVRARSETVKRIIAPAGLSSIKTAQIQSALKKIMSDFGKCSLDALKGLSADRVQDYLVTLDGVSVKVAKCVMMYTMGYEVLPVDTHVHRVAVRLGWTDRKRADQCHDELESLVPASRRLAFHVDCIAHGRLVCTPKTPSCGECCIRNYCDYHRRSS